MNDGIIGIPFKCRIAISTSPFFGLCLLHTGCRTDSASGQLLFFSLGSAGTQALRTFHAIDTSSKVHFRSSSHDLRDYLYSLLPYPSLATVLDRSIIRSFDKFSCPILDEGPTFIFDAALHSTPARTVRYVAL